MVTIVMMCPFDSNHGDGLALLTVNMVMMWPFDSYHGDDERKFDAAE